MERSIMEIILSLLVLGGIGTILAFLLEIADTYLRDYGEKHIVINNEKDLVVEGGRPLLASLMDEKIFIPSACGGKGTCAFCKVTVHEGGGPLLPTETPYLSEEERKAHIRLSCQVKVKNDLKIEIPEALFQAMEYQAKVTRIETLTPEIKGLSLDIITPQQGIVFRPGQYVQLEVPTYKRSKTPEYRAYSIASDARDRRAITLVIARSMKGVVSTYVHDVLKEADELVIRGPYGDFFLRESDNPILLVATGSGLAPMMSILHQIESENIQRQTTLFFGDRTHNDLFYFEALRDFERKIEHFDFIPTLSRPKEEDQWQGEIGRVTDLIEKHIPDNAVIDAYLCGSPQMVESCMTTLRNKGISEDRIFFDKFE